jgi:DNA repair exonuclease SbcCD ATPase subunit
MKPHLLSIICASIIVLGGSFIVVNTILAKDEVSELDKRAQEAEREFQKQSQKIKEIKPQEGLNTSPLVKKEGEQINEAQEKILEQQREQAQRLSEKTREAEKQSLEKKGKEDSPNPEGQEDSVDALSEQIIVGPEREKRIKDKCQEISNRIAEHQNELKAKAEKRLGKYNKIIIRLEAVSVKLVDLGVDMSTYNGYVAEVKSRVNELNQLTNVYIASLASDNIQLCNKDTAGIELNTRKSDLKVIIAQDKAVRSYIKETIIPYLRSIKPQQPASIEQETVPTPCGDNPSTVNGVGCVNPDLR